MVSKFLPSYTLDKPKSAIWKLEQKCMELIGADVHRVGGADVHGVSGTDLHGVNLSRFAWSKLEQILMELI